METSNQEYASLAAEIVSAYVSHNSVPSTELPSLLQSVYGTVSTLGSGGGAAAPEEKRPEPPVSIKKSVTPDHLICLEDGKKFKSLRRHLMSTYKMTPDDYRKRWELPADYPMVAPNYSKVRSELALQNGLGKPRKAATRAPSKKGKKAA